MSPERLQVLLGIPVPVWTGSWGRLLTEHPQSVLPGLAQTLIDASLDLVHYDIDAAQRAALAARACARKTRNLPADARADLLAQAWATLANAHRVAGDYPRAEQAWCRVSGLLKRGTGKTTPTAFAAWLRGRLRTDQRHFEQAVGEYGQALLLAKKEKRQREEGIYRLELSAALSAKGSLSAARFNVLEAQRCLSGVGDRRLLFFSVHQEVLILNDLGEKKKALVLSRLLERHYPTYTGPIGQLRGRWVLGRLHASQGQHHQAAAIFADIRESFLAREMLYDAALVSLDLALSYAERGELGRVRTLAHEMYEVFRAQQIPREASAALILFAHTALDEQANAAFILGIIQQLDTLHRQSAA